METSMNSQFISMLTLVTKEVKRVLRIWVQTLIPPAITMSLYFLIFGNIIGKRIGEMVPGIGYIEYIAPGLILMSVITNSYGNVVSSFFNAKIQGHIQEMLVAPMSEVSIVLGFVAGGMVRGLFVASVVSLISLFFTDLTIQHPILTIVVIIMTAAVFSLAGLVNAIFARTFDEIAIIPSFVLAPLTYLGGVFYTISLLPDFWQVVSRFNPILYMVNSMRYSMLGVSDIDIIDGLLMITFFFFLLLSIAILLLKKGVGIRD
jgi:ABC-2 type transport system permease protein